MTTERQPKTLRDLANHYADHLGEHHDTFYNVEWDDWYDAQHADTLLLDAVTDQASRIATLEQHISTITGQLEMIRRYYNLHQRFQHGGNPENEI